MLIARRYVLRGRVQGVGFRYFAEDVAHRERLSGYVRNLVDGDVEALVEGDADSVTRFEIAVRQGPRGARVESVEVNEVEPTGRFTGFSVRG